jgi:hypothetical protein
MMKWIRLLIEGIVFVALVAAGILLYIEKSNNDSLENQISTLKNKSSKGSNVDSSQSSRMAELINKESELEAVKAALSGGQALLDVEAAAKAAKIESPERYLAIGALRLLVKGSNDPSAAKAFEKALEMNQWNVRLRSVCAAQAGMLASGLKVDILADCKRIEELNKKNSLEQKKLNDQNNLRDNSEDNSQQPGV